ncbi:hypothetical protein Tco_0334724, partial [Tanacetum coccineum]
MKLATKRSKTQFHSSHTSGSGDGVDSQSKVPDEKQQKTFGTDEGTGDSDEEEDDDEDAFEGDANDNDDGDDGDDNDGDDNDGNDGNDDDKADSE